MLDLTAKTGRSLARHAVLFSALTVVALAALYALHRAMPSDAALLASSIIVGALIVAPVYAIVLDDESGGTAGNPWSRALERAWAVIVVELVQGFAVSLGFGSLVAGDLFDRIFAIPTLLIAIVLVFADVDVVVADGDAWWLLVPQAFMRSVQIAWRGPVLIRAIILIFAPVAFAQIPLHAALVAGHVSDARFWAIVLPNTIPLVPFAVLTALVYLDASGYESKRPCSE